MDPFSPPLWDSASQSSERFVRSLLDRVAYLLVPPQVKVVSYEDPDGLKAKALRYPLPADLATPVPMARLREMTILRRDVLHVIGWRQIEETDDLLPDFLRLASGTLREVADFASRWGPLWLCVAHANCALAGDGLGAACDWSPLEPIDAWRREAQAAKAVLEIASRLNVEALPYEVWQQLEIEREQFERMKLEGDRRQQAHLLAGLVQARLDGPWRPRVCLSSTIGNDACGVVSTTMVLDIGLGFRSAVWHQIAQLLCRLDEVYICAGCHQPYQRGIRKPRPDQDNFCPDCRKDGKAAKRLWAARYRERTQQQALAGRDRSQEGTG
jgi:hypothetical protein